MASDLTTALLSGNAANMAAVDPATLSIMPQLSLAQAMMQGGLSGAPAYPAQALGRLAQALVGSKMMGDATGELQHLYGQGVEAASRALPEDHPLQKFLKSPDPMTRMIGMRNLDKALIQLGEGAQEKAKNPALIERAGGTAAAEAPYKPAGEGVFPGGPSGLQKGPITAAELAEAARLRGAQPPVVGGPQTPQQRMATAPQFVSPAALDVPPNHLPPPADMRAAPRPPVAPPSISAPAAPAPGAPAAGSPAPGPGAFNTVWNDRVAGPARLGGTPVETPEYKSQMETFGKAGGAIGDVLKEHIEAGGKNARDRMNALDSIESAMRTNNGQGVVTGPQAEHILRFREMLDGMGIKTDWIREGMPQSEMVQKMNAQLASASVKAMSSRPTQFEFATFQKNNPGLSNSREGTLALIHVLRQNAQQDIDLGRLAQNQENWRQWPKVVDEYYANPEHGLKNPFTGKSMREEIQAARSGGGGGAPTATGTGGAGGGAAPVHVNSIDEARKLPSGTRIILPDGSPGRVP